MKDKPKLKILNRERGRELRTRSHGNVTFIKKSTAKGMLKVLLENNTLAVIPKEDVIVGD